MKSKILSLIAAIVCASLISSCNKSFLTRPPQGALSEEVLATQAGVQGLLVGAYSALRGQGPGVQGSTPWSSAADNWIYGSVCGADAHKGSQGGDQPPIDPLALFSVDPTDPFLDDKWRADYTGVSRCNNTLKVLAKTQNIPAALRTNIEAQARFLRAYFYLDLKKMFNYVPWIDETTTDVNQPNTENVWPKIESDFSFAMDSLPATQAAIGQANKWAAEAFLAKVYLYEKKYAQAKDLFIDVINNGTTSNGLKYALEPEFEDNFLPQDELTNPEAVFPIEAAANTGTGDISQARGGDILNYPYPNSPWCCGFFQPTQDLVNSYRTDPSTGLPYINGYNQYPVKSDMGISSSQPFTLDQGTLDPRLDWTVGRRGIPYLDWGNHPGMIWIRDQSYGGPYDAKKNLHWQATKSQYFDGHSWGPGNAINYVPMRFAQVLLMAAECEAQLGNLDLAETLVNMIRNRAANPAGWVHAYIDPNNPMGGFTNTPAANYFIKPYPQGYFSQVGQGQALACIYYEEKLELAMEGHRFFDLVRWGIADSTLNAYFAFEGKITTDVTSGHFTKGKNEYFPIPQTEIDLSVVNGKPILKQNSGY